MNKKIKIVSTVALASLLTLNVFNVKALATKIEEKGKTQIYGAYEEIKDLKNVVPVILESSTTDLASDFDKVTFAEIKEVYPTATDFSGNEDCVATGDTFKVGEETYTILVYGDVNKDGKISSLDAIEIQKYSIGMNEGLETIQLLAADVATIDNKINSSVDAVAIRKYSSRIRSTVVSEVTPDLVEAETSINSTIEVGEDNLLNVAEVSDKITIKATLTELYSEEKDLVVKMYKDGDSENDILVGKDVKIHFNGTQKESSVTLKKDETYAESLNDYDGTVKIELWDGDVLVGVKEIEVHTIKPKATEVLVSTNRINSSEATANFTYYGENKVGKILYYVGTDTKSNISDLNKNSEFSNNKIEELKVSTDLKTDTVYKLSYAVEDVYGNQSEEIETAIISKDKGNAHQRHAVTELKIPDVSKEEKFLTWKSDEDLSGAKIRVTIYNGEKVIEVNETKDGEKANSDYELDITKYLKSAGEYKFEVVVLGSDDGTYYDSEAVTSDVIKIEALKPVTDITFEVTEDGKYQLSWKDEQNDKDNIDNYTVKLAEKSSPETKNEVKGSVDKDTCTVTLTLGSSDDFDYNKVYTAFVTANSSNKLFIDSEEASSKEFFVIDLSKIQFEETTPKERGENYITLQAPGLADLTINEKTPTYKLKIYKVVEKTSIVPDHSMIDVEEVREDNVILDENNKIKVDGLDPDTKYAFKLIATFDDATGESKFLGAEGEIKTLKVAPKIENLTYYSKEAPTEDQVEKSFYKQEENKVSIRGQEYDLTSEEYTKEFRDLAKLIVSINLYDEDIIKSATQEKISIELCENSGTTPVEIPANTEIEITGNALSRPIKVGENANVTLTGEKAIFEIKEGTGKKITVTDGVTVEGDVTYTIESKATINDVDVTVSQETEMKASGSEFEVTVDGDSTTNYTFETRDGAKGVEVSFVSKNKNLTDRQLGEVKILSNGKVTVTSDQVAIGGKLNVEVKSGEANVNVSDNAINKTLTLKAGVKTVDEGIKVKAKNPAPVDMSDGISVDATDETLADKFTGEGEADAARAYLDSFNLKGTGATITVEKGQNDVTIKINTPLEKDVEIGNI